MCNHNTPNVATDVATDAVTADEECCCCGVILAADEGEETPDGDAICVCCYRDTITSRRQCGDLDEDQSDCDKLDECRKMGLYNF